ncbi:hypothetical protein [Undibacterium flavidum]|uniref:Glycine zipper 2TM domain-containing protein n=1 Tax=Undibacterium flavidum TaxID=2762297 RepID=A0ABR6Y847_9BURK|nr:hypothetical protein [Undibacterium flavidum]MBC3872801.1 hypothetical protein [Undibacterium flavidum]
MRKIALIAAALILTQLGGCVVHRYRASDARNYNNDYGSSYSNQSYGQYADPYASQQIPQQAQYQDRYGYPDNYNGNYQNNTDVAQIVNIRNVTQVRESSGGGAVVGAILGGIIGNQLGRDDGNGSHGSRYDRRGRHYDNRSHGGNEAGRAAATVGGAILGGIIGNEVDRSSSEQVYATEITLRLANGRTQTVLMNNPGQFRIGDRVRVGMQNGRWIIL